jgi:hypothetical protein
LQKSFDFATKSAYNLSMYKATFKGRKGDLGLTEQGVSFTPYNKGETVLIPYANLGRVNPPNPISIFFKIIFFPFVLLYFIICAAGNTNANVGGGAPAIKIYTKDNNKFVFYSRHKNRLVREIRDHIQR